MDVFEGMLTEVYSAAGNLIPFVLFYCLGAKKKRTHENTFFSSKLRYRLGSNPKLCLEIYTILCYRKDFDIYSNY